MLYSRFSRLAAFILPLLLLSGCDLLRGEEEVNVQVVRLDDTEVTAHSAPPGWKVGQRHDDQLTLEVTLEDISSLGPDFDGSIQGVCCGQTVFLTLSEIYRELPVFEDLWVGKVGSGGGYELRKGKILIQDWNPDGRMSGYIDGRLAGFGKKIVIAFWIDPDSTSN